jgi:hypothetical protein
MILIIRIIPIHDTYEFLTDPEKDPFIFRKSHNLIQLYGIVVKAPDSGPRRPRFDPHDVRKENEYLDKNISLLK